MLNTRVIQPTLKKSFARRHVQNYDLCKAAVDKLGLADYYRGKNTTLIDAYPGAGVWSAALNEAVQPKKHVLLEPVVTLNKYLRPLVPELDSVTLRSEDPFRWRTFTELADAGVYTPINYPRDQPGVNPHLLYTANLTSTQGEQLCVQYLNCMLNRNWLQRYGRVRLLLWVRQSTAIKVLGLVGSKQRQRVSVQSQACAVSTVAIAPEDHPIPGFDTLVTCKPSDWFLERGSISGQVVLLQMDPAPNTIEHVDAFEYVIRSLFVLRQRPLIEALGNLGPGAPQDLAPRLAPEILTKTPADMSMDEIYAVVEAFAKWPFKPDILHDFYEEYDAVPQTHV